MSPAAAARPRLLLPELDRLWIRYAPRARDWRTVAPPGELRWLDLAAGELGGGGTKPATGGGAIEAALPAGPFDDLLYLPPVVSGHPDQAAARDAAAAAVAAEGTPVLVQVLAGEEVGEALGAEGIVVVRDLFEPLLARDLDALSVPGRGETEQLGRSIALWPLVRGLTDDPELVDEGCRRLAEAGFRVVQGVAPDLPAAQRRQLYERLAPAPAEEGEDGDDALFQVLFHSQGADPRAFACAAHRHGLEPFLPRPLPRPPLTGAPEREIAGLLATAGELCFRLGQVGRGQAHLRAARWIDRTAYDLRALAREGNLPVLHWLDPESRRIVEEWAAAGRSATIDTLLGDYLIPAGSPNP